MRATAIELMGSGIGSIPLDRLVAAVGGVLGAAATAGLALDTVTAPLSEVEQRWEEAGAQRLVFVP